MLSTLICYDGSASAEHALDLARQMLDRYQKVLLTVWTVPERIHADSFGYESPPGAPSYEQLCELVEQAAQESAEQGAQMAAQLGLDVQIRVERNRSTVWRTILDVADELDSDLIVVGTRGTTAVQSGLLGSVSGSLVHESRRPVLLVPTPDRGADGAKDAPATSRAGV
ncbi:MAG TPA: universal stress protein [Solirubrobacteraceae bacterium]|nr:universal stress protein [Solirubrobacteraceae bacterium]